MVRLHYKFFVAVKFEGIRNYVIPAKAHRRQLKVSSLRGYAVFSRGNPEYFTIISKIK